MSLSTEYRGYEIRYSENEDIWRCHDCKVSAPTLSGAKEKIDKLHLKLRKAAALPCYEISAQEARDGWRVQATEATAIEYLGPIRERGWSNPKAGEVKGHKVATMAQRQGSTRKARRDSSLRDLAPVTPEVHAAIQEADRLGSIAFEAAREFRAAISAIPRVRFEDIEGLVEASGHKFEET